MLNVSVLFLLDLVTRTEMEKRERELEELTGRYNTECEMRRQTELQRDNLTTELVLYRYTRNIYSCVIILQNQTSEELNDTKNQVIPPNFH